MSSGSNDPSESEGPSFRESVKRIFVEVCDLEPQTRRDRLEQLCGGDLRLRQEVEKLIQHDSPDKIFESDMEV
jgi:hypothetical protein